MTRGTPEHVAWVRGWLAAAHSYGHTSRDAIRKWARAYGREHDVRYPTRRDLEAVGWRDVPRAERLDVPPVATEPAPVAFTEPRHLVDASVADMPAIEVDTSELDAPVTLAVTDASGSFEATLTAGTYQHTPPSAVSTHEPQAPLDEAAPPLAPIPSDHVVAGLSTLVSGDGATVAQWVKTRRKEETRAEVLERLMRELPTRLPAREGAVPAPSLTDGPDLLAVYPMGDPHIGMLSWAPETGEDFDLAKAQRILCSAMRELVTRGPRTESALIANLGDFFHSDNEQNRTARSGHALDVDGRWSKVLQVGIEILVYMIDQALAHHRTVRVVNEIGNHDDHSAVFLSVALNAYYRNQPRVEIDMSPSRFHWHRFGRNLIGITHGHNQKHGDLEAIMAAERAADWGETTHRFWLCGHIHHSVRREMRGCVIESFRTLAARDAWAANTGYRSGRDMSRITLHREFGEVGRETVNASYLQAMYDGAP